MRSPQVHLSVITLVPKTPTCVTRLLLPLLLLLVVAVTGGWAAFASSNRVLFYPVVWTQTHKSPVLC